MADNAHFIKDRHVNAFLSRYETIKQDSPVQVLMAGDEFYPISSSLLAYEDSKWIFLEEECQSTWPAYNCIAHADGKYRVLTEDMRVIEIDWVNIAAGMKYRDSVKPLLDAGVAWYMPLLERR